MTITYTSAANNTLSKTLIYPEGFKISEKILEETASFHFNNIAETVKTIAFNGVHMEEQQLLAHRGLVTEIRHDFAFLRMQFELEACPLFRMLQKQKSNEGKLFRQKHQLSYIPALNKRLSASSSMSSLEIKLTFEFLKRFFIDDLSSLSDFGKAISNDSAAILSSKKMPLTFPMRAIVAEITTCPYCGAMKKVFLECKIIELLLLQLTQYEQDLKAVAPAANKRDNQKLFFVKELIEDNIKEPYTILQLSEIAGINDFKLKRDFKEQFGETLFGHLSTYRLEKAKQLLLDGEHSISEISYLIGYRHPQHFTVAFKRKYGYLPSDIKKAVSD